MAGAAPAGWVWWVCGVGEVGQPISRKRPPAALGAWVARPIACSPCTRGLTSVPGDARPAKATRGQPHHARSPKPSIRLGAILARPAKCAVAPFQECAPTAPPLRSRPDAARGAGCAPDERWARVRARMTEPDDTVAPWPLSAATTRMLLAFPPASVLTGVVDWPSQNELIKLCVKEFLLRGTWRMTGTQQRFLRSPRVFVEPHWPPPPLPVPLDQFDAAMRRHGMGGELGPTLRRIATAERMLGPLLISATVAELRRYGLIESRTVPAQGFAYEVMVRSAAGDAWAQSAEAWTAAVRALPDVIDVDEVTAEHTVSRCRRACCCSCRTRSDRLRG